MPQKRNVADTIRAFAKTGLSVDDIAIIVRRPRYYVRDALKRYPRKKAPLPTFVPLGVRWRQQIAEGTRTVEQLSELFPDVDVARVLEIIHRRYQPPANQRK